MSVRSTYDYLHGMAQQGKNGRKAVCYGYAGGKKRWAWVEMWDEETVVASIYGNRIIWSKPTELTLWHHGWKSRSNVDAFAALLSGVSVKLTGALVDWQVTVFTKQMHQGSSRILHFSDGVTITEKAPEMIQLVPVSELREGDLIDLEGDPLLGLCDFGTCEDCDGTHLQLEHELQRVDTTTVETPECTVVYFEQCTFALPPDHLLNVHERGPIPVSREFMQGAPEVEVDTPFGSLYLQATGQDSILVNCNSDGRCIIVNNVRVSFLQHWWLTGDGSWTDVPPDRAVGTTLAITRRDDWNKPASVTCYRKVRETIPTVVREWAETPIGMHWLRHAQEAKINNRARQIEERIGDEEAKLASSKAELANLLGKDVREIEEALRG